MKVRALDAHLGNESVIGFYETLGVMMLDEWRICRLEEDQLAGVAGMMVRVEGGG